MGKVSIHGCADIISAKPIKLRKKGNNSAEKRGAMQMRM